MTKIGKPQMVFVKDIIEKNGKTIEQNNLERKHNIPIDTLVEVKFDKWLDNGACLKIHARLWVYQHTRDCDGTPLYTLSRDLSKTTEQLISHFGLWNGYIFTGFNEESLTLVKVTPELARGEGALTWD